MVAGGTELVGWAEVGAETGGGKLEPGMVLGVTMDVLVETGVFDPGAVDADVVAPGVLEPSVLGGVLEPGVLEASVVETGAVVLLGGPDDAAKVLGTVLAVVFLHGIYGMIGQHESACALLRSTNLLVASHESLVGENGLERRVFATFQRSLRLLGLLRAVGEAELNKTDGVFCQIVGRQWTAVCA